ncbi:MAG TPA: IclR family transcriptional regulator [Egicoccus sp.]|nr:IclR family transcriptional regulator [Egicoccus sp.]HSK24873.1 IclR family transcriptional regulator [Egicoccus sp.]
MPGSYLQTLARGIEVLEALKQGARTVNDLADLIAVERSAVYRLVRTLEHHGYVVRDGRTGLCRLGLAAWELGAHTDLAAEVREAASPHLDQLVQRFGETAHLSLYDRGEVVYIHRVEGTHAIGSYTRLGGRAPAHCVATGKALLAHQPAHEVDRVIAAGLARHTPLTIVDGDELRDVLGRVAAGEVAVNRGEWREDVGGLAVPLVGARGQAVAAIGLSGPVDRILAQREPITAALRDAARAIIR